MTWLPQLDPDRAATELGGWIAEARRLARFSQQALADRVGVSQSTISRVERGLVPSARLSTLAPLLIFLRTELATAESHRQAMNRVGWSP